MNFQIDRIEPDGLIVGRNSYMDIPVGTEFVALAKCRVDGQLPNLTTVDLGVVAAIDLRLIEVQWFRKSVEVIPSGHTAGIRLEGTGLNALEAALASKQEREFIFIRA